RGAGRADHKLMARPPPSPAGGGGRGDETETPGAAGTREKEKRKAKKKGEMIFIIDPQKARGASLPATIPNNIAASAMRDAVINLMIANFVTETMNEEWGARDIRMDHAMRPWRCDCVPPCGGFEGASEAGPFVRPKYDDYFGGCPECGQHNGCRSIG